MNKTVDIILDLQLSEALEQNSLDYPDTEQIKDWIMPALLKDAQLNKKKLADSIELTLRIVDAAEIQHLNKSYRHMDKVTNILSFPFEAPEYISINLLGDLVVCHSVIEQEAIDQQKPLMAHWAHIIIHGVLHLLGYDHIENDEADEMENIEIEIMQNLGYKNPYH